MELIFALAMKFWQWTILIAVVIIGWAINFFDKRRPNKLTFKLKTNTSSKPASSKPAKMRIFVSDYHIDP